MGLCTSKPSVVGSPVAGEPEHYLTHTTEQTTPSTPSSPEAPMSPSLHGLVAIGSSGTRRGRFRQPTLQPHEVQQAAYQLGMRLNGRPIEDASDRQRLADATETVHETRLALHRGRGNVDSDLRLSNGRSAIYTDVAYAMYRDEAGSGLAVGAGNCDHNAAINARQHAVRMEDGGQMMTVRECSVPHVYALYQPPGAAEAKKSAVVLDSWCDGPATLLRDSRWAETYGTTTTVVEKFDKPAASAALNKANAYKTEIEDPQTANHAYARQLEEALLFNQAKRAPQYAFPSMPVIAPDLAQSTRQRLQEHSPRTREALAADAARQAYALDDAQPISPRTTAAILEDAERLDALGRPPLSW
ncbi:MULTISPECIES: XopE/AvrPphe family type III secretion system effector [Xanthomonas]|uniref:XopE/AvrPphe family type III secretion system effector n=1 Tax=Xanthomonas TaxID=338 RepID=UPI0006E58811|nr:MULTISPECIES: XopE/AvrPphe family type III secretion system effector [Xanthomonas]MBO9749516.1 avirulence protein [Xanthomonas phaseoli pv. dieffenbachiae]MBO9753722.1 avirulence protein [Xanthomonas phaseoli pv. dieffenbachiae]MBO9877845.1 avirulence protein [Xanthomonas sp. D-99]MBO9890524.1 avirulence protein [Xanthomonas sp. D-36-1]OQP75663.1 avirulence protein [Xanthomonas citri]